MKIFSEFGKKKFLQKIPIFFLIFFIPLFFGFGEINNLDFTKQAILIFLSFLALNFWIFSGVFEGKFQFRFSFFHLVSFLFLIFLLVSTIFSKWRWGSFWGWPLDSGFSFLTFLCFFIIFLLISNLFERKDVLFLQYLLIFSGFFVALIGIFQIFGKFFLPFGFTKINSFNTIGTVNSWGIFLATFLPLILAFIFLNKRFLKIISLIFLGVFFFGLILTNYWVIWIGSLISISLFLIFIFWRFTEVDSKLLVLPILMFSLAVFFCLIRVPIPGPPSLPFEVSPSLGATFNVSKEMIRASPSNLVFGFGPGTFKYGWSKFKSPDLNQTIFWNLRFSKGGSEVLENLGTIGILGTMFFLLFFGSGIFFGAKEILKLQKEGKFSEWVLLLGILCSFVFLSSTKFLYPSNLTLGFLWWVLFGNLVIFFPKKINSFNLKTEPKMNFFYSFVVILILAGTIFLFYFEGTRYFGEMKYSRSLGIGDLEKTESLLLEAIRLNPQQEIFWRDLSQVYLARINQEILRTDISATEKNQRILNFIQSAVTASKRTTDINPEDALNWQIRGGIYKSLIDITGWNQDLFDWTVKSYEKALTLDPSNPFIYVELSSSYLVQARLAQVSQSLEKAEDYIKKAIELKPDYALAHFQKALISEAQGKREEAISILEGLKQAAPFIGGYDPMQDVGLAFQLGVLYYRDEKYDRAQIEFERAVNLSPNYSNARYFLGLIYDKKGQKEKAIEQFEEIEKLNPENQEVKQILSNLRAGKPALEEIAVSPEVLPIEEKPKER